MHMRSVLVYVRINPVTKHIFFCFLATANLVLHLFFIVNHYRRERLSIALVNNADFLYAWSSSYIVSFSGCRLATSIVCGHSVVDCAPAGVHWSSDRFTEAHLGWSIFLFIYNASSVFV